MLSLLEQVSPTILRLHGEQEQILSNLDVAGKGGRKGYVDIRLNRRGEISAIHITGIIGHDRLLYRPDNQNAFLFSGKSFFDPEYEPYKIAQKCLNSCNKLLDKQLSTIDAKSAAREAVARFDLAMKNPQEFHDRLLSLIRTESGKDTDLTKFGFFINSNNRDAFSIESLREINAAVTQSRSETSQSNSRDIFGHIGAVNNEPCNSVLVPQFCKVSLYGRNEQSNSDQIYGRKSVDCCPVTNDTLTRLKTAFIALTSGRFAQQASTVTHIDGHPTLLLAVPVGYNNSESLQRCEEIQKNLGVRHRRFKQDEDTDKDAEETTETEMSLSEFGKESIKLSEAILQTSGANITDLAFFFGIYRKSSSCFVVTEAETMMPAEQLSKQIKKWAEINASASIFKIIGKEKFVRICDIAQLVNCKWSKCAGMMNGRLDFDIMKNYTNEVKFITLKECFQFLFYDDINVTRKIIQIFSKYHIHLLRDIGNCKIRSQYVADAQNFFGGKRWDALRITVLMAICLQRIGMTMDNIQESPMFLLGRLCTLMSEAQALYHMRDSVIIDTKRLPLQLVGDQFIGSLLSCSGSSILSIYGHIVNRCRPYLRYIERQCWQYEATKKPDQSAQPNLTPAEKALEKAAIIFKTTCAIRNRLIEALNSKEIPVTLSPEEKGLVALGYTTNPKKG